MLAGGRRAPVAYFARDHLHRLHGELARQVFERHRPPTRNPPAVFCVRHARLRPLGPRARPVTRPARRATARRFQLVQSRPWSGSGGPAPLHVLGDAHRPRHEQRHRPPQPRCGPAPRAGTPHVPLLPVSRRAAPRPRPPPPPTPRLAMRWLTSWCAGLRSVGKSAPTAAHVVRRGCPCDRQPVAEVVQRVLDELAELFARHVRRDELPHRCRCPAALAVLVAHRVVDRNSLGALPANCDALNASTRPFSNASSGAWMVNDSRDGTPIEARMLAASAAWEGGRFNFMGC